MLLLLALACTPPPAGAPAPCDTGSCDTGPVDDDADGFLAADDCDDTRADVYPGAPGDLPGDDVDTDCDGIDGPAFAGCAPIDVPDVYATIEDALAAGEVNLCLGVGTFTPLAAVGDTTPTAFRGQGRALTTVVDPSALYTVGLLDGLTATGVVAGPGSAYWSDVTITDTTVTGMDNLTCDRCAFERAPIEVSVNARGAGITLNDSWVTGATVGLHVVTDGCATAGSCPGDYIDLRAINSTFSDDGTDVSLELSGDYAVSVVLDNSIFVDQAASVLAVTTSGAGAAPQLSTSGTATIVWNSGGENFPDGYSFPTTHKDPLLDATFHPPRPLEGSPAIDAGGWNATATDFWGLPRTVADIGAVER